MSSARIETQRLLLRPFAGRDVDALHRLFVMPDVRRYLLDDVAIEREKAVEIVEASQSDFAEQGYGLCVLEPRGREELVGFCGIRRFMDPDQEERQPELLYGLHPDHWRKGFAAEASVAILRFGFEECELPVIHAGIDPPNTRSRRVIEALGMKDWRAFELHGQPCEYARLMRADFDAKGAAYALVVRD